MKPLQAVSENGNDRPSTSWSSWPLREKKNTRPCLSALLYYIVDAIKEENPHLFVCPCFAAAAMAGDETELERSPLPPAEQGYFISVHRCVLQLWRVTWELKINSWFRCLILLLYHIIIQAGYPNHYHTNSVGLFPFPFLFLSSLAILWKCWILAVTSASENTQAMLVSIDALQRHFREDGFCLLPLFGKWKGKNFY